MKLKITHIKTVVIATIGASSLYGMDLAQQKSCHEPFFFTTPVYDFHFVTPPQSSQYQNIGLPSHAILSTPYQVASESQTKSTPITSAFRSSATSTGASSYIRLMELAQIAKQKQEAELARAREQEAERARARKELEDKQRAKMEAKADQLTKLLGYKHRSQVSPTIFNGLFEDPEDHMYPEVNRFRPASPYAYRKKLEEALGIKLWLLRPYFQK